MESREERPQLPRASRQMQLSSAVHQLPNLNALQALPRASSATPLSPEVHRLRSRIETRTATVGVCGMGYVGLPLAVAAANAGFTLIGFDIDQDKTKALNEGVSYITGVGSDNLKDLRGSR